jgi:hypothetical protein
MVQYSDGQCIPYLDLLSVRLGTPGRHPKTFGFGVVK